MYKDLIERLACVVLLAGVFMLLPGGVTQTKAAYLPYPSGIPFYGEVETYVPPTLVCPVAHTKITNLITGTPMGLVVTPASEVFLNYDLLTPGVTLMGTYWLPIIPCPLPYPLVPISQVGTD